MVFKYDLHNHSENSFDCNAKGRDLIRLAKSRGLEAIGICEHDNFPDYDLESYAYQIGINLVLGIEFSCIDAHIIGYNLQLLNRDESYLRQKFKDFYQAHKQHGSELISQLRRKGFQITEENITEFSGRSIVTAFDIFRYYADFTRDYDSWQETRKHFRIRGVFDITRKEDQHFNPYEVIQIIKRSKGVAIWAHPLFSSVKRGEYFAKFNPQDIFIELNYPYIENGIEFGNSNQELFNILRGRSEKRNFLYSGGSDSHYPIKKHNSGEPICPGDFGFNSNDAQILHKLFG